MKDGTKEPVRIAGWSGPRNISTAFMRAWENREDTVVVDEPLYAHYLAATGLDHVDADKVIAEGEPDWRAMVDKLLGPVPGGHPVYYQKHMAHHLLPGMDRSWIKELTNVILIRDPRQVVASYVKTAIKNAELAVTPEDIGVPQQVTLFDELTEIGARPPVVDAMDLLNEPEAVLRALCDHAGIEFTDRMLSWPPGPRPTDGVWGASCYDRVWKSTGFEPYRPRAGELPAGAERTVNACLPHYEYLLENRIKV
ncbi:sulfotransferase [Actinomadura litoris]|uniref:sulfotransferase n=1 Tax=Actinomadura litoris TaxID=2678616 RepID=UPI001FA77784|nr:sulfotransferase [Actinomadura litoris]